MQEKAMIEHGHEHGAEPGATPAGGAPAARTSGCGSCSSSCGSHGQAHAHAQGPIPISSLNRKAGAGDGKRVFVFSNGCVENQMDHTRLQSYFEHNGWQNVGDYKDADLVVFNTCGVDEAIENQSIAKIEEFKSNSGAELIVGGCLPKINSKRLDTVHSGPNFGPRTMNRLDNIIAADVSIDEVRVNRVERTLGHTSFLTRVVSDVVEITSMVDEHLKLGLVPLIRKFGVTWYDTRMFYLDLGVGCLSHCSFCAIKHAKGNVQSTPIDEVVAQFQEGLRQGVREFVLSSDDCGSYGRDIGTDLVALLERLTSFDGDYKLHVRYVEPSRLLEIIDRLLALLARTDKIVSLTSSIQSGNNRVLGDMNKDVRVEDWIRCIQAVNTTAPTLSFRTQVIVGFPGESDDEFRDTLRLFDLIDIDSAGVYEYSDRPHTRASRMVDKLPEDIKKRRKQQVMRKMITRKARRSGMRLIDMARDAARQLGAV